MFQGSTAVFFFVAFLAYIGLMIFIAWLTTRKGGTEGEDYLMGGRSVGLILLIGTAAASAIGTGTSVGATANGFRSAWLGALYPLANGLGLITIALSFTFVRKFKFRTLAEEVQFYYNGSPQIRKFMAFILLVVSIIWVGSGINGGANYLSYLLGMDLIVAKVITVLAFGVYVFVGGYMAVVWTDAIQAFLLFFGFIFMAILAVPAAGGMENIIATFDAAGKAGAMTPLAIGEKGILGLLAIGLASYYGSMAGPSAHTRIYTAKSPATAKKAILIASGVVICFSVLPALVGMSAFTIATQNGAESVLANPDFTFAYMATTVFTPAIGLIFLIAGLSAILSSADTDVMCAVTTFVTDLYAIIMKKQVQDKDIPKYSRGILVFILLTAFTMSVFATDVMSYINNVIGGLTPGLGVALLLGRFWKRATWQGGIAALSSGIVFGFLYLVVAPFNAYITDIFQGPALPVTIVSLLCAVVTSLATPPSTLSEEERVALVMRERAGEVVVKMK